MVTNIIFCIVSIVEILLSLLIYREQQIAWGIEKLEITLLFFALLCGVVWQNYRIVLLTRAKRNSSKFSKSSFLLILIGIFCGLSSLSITFLGGPHALVAPFGLVLQIGLVFWALRTKKGVD